MKRFYVLIALLVVLLTACANHTTINTYPQGAKIRVDGELIGISPVNWEDHGVAGTSITVNISKNGFKDLTETITKNNLYVHRFFTPPILALPWIAGYRDQYTFELEPINKPAANNIEPSPQQTIETKEAFSLDQSQWNRIFLTSDQLPVNVKYEVIKSLQVGGGWYGSSDQALQWLADEARTVGANAVIEVKTWHQPTGGSWAAPHGSGIAIRIITPGAVDYSRLTGTWK